MSDAGLDLVGKARELVRAAGAVAAFRANWPPVLAHMHSTLRMGSRASDSVLDEYAEARAISRGTKLSDKTIEWHLA